MEIDQHELYEYARLRLKQKKRLYFHFVLFFVGSIFMIVANKLLDVKPEINWYQWGIAFWGFIFTLHFIRVFITDSFMNKKWERAQIDKLIMKQKRKLEQIERDFNSKNNISQQ
ncbi:MULTISPECIES: 2TM domain-containing protein [Flavobacterium]|uniref:2TM domain-containing protein n=1 Tax=Flavobacterium TaxID=237 RepID=UPI001FCC6719|nr:MULTISPECIES: 2TM domain-containing protein [Flavobacterium]UOK43542.1 2TM domain-containing protein [Flavobacterium enshiense]